MEIFFGKCENLFFGDIPEDLILLAGKLKPTDSAESWHDYVEEEIKRLGYRTQREVFVVYDEKKKGRIDLVVKKYDIEVAIELDYRTPRKKSIKKVKTYDRGLVLLRDPKIVRKIRF